MFGASEIKNIGLAAARFPSLEHLMALKLHVVKQNLPQGVLGDLDHIVNLVLANRVNLREEKWRQLFVKYGTLEVYEKIVHATAG